MWITDQVPTSKLDSPVSDIADAVQSDRHDPAVSDTAPVAAVVNPALIDTVMHDFVHDYLARHFLHGTWPTELELIADMAASL